MSSRRPETGPMQFDDDWPGLFIRGDNAHYYALALSRLMDGDTDVLTVEAPLRGLLELLRGTHARSGVPQQKMKAFVDCKGEGEDA